MHLEVCVDCLESAANAVYSGADELELCRNLRGGGGLTPTVAFVKQVIDMIDLYMGSSPKNVITQRPKLNIMIRSHEGWDFSYNKYEISEMMRDMSAFKELGVDRFVFGCLTSNLEVDEAVCRTIVRHASPKPVTFHRAFDRCRNPYEAIKTIISLGFDRVLTSGQKDCAADKLAIELIKSLVFTFGNKIDIMPGAGINPENAQIFLDIGCKYIHGSFKKVMPPDSLDVFITDSEAVTKVKKQISFAGNRSSQ